MIDPDFSLKSVNEMIMIVHGDLIDLKDKGETVHLDAVVNAAKCMLMGGSGVDGRILLRRIRRFGVNQEMLYQYL